ncbi:hypothetical protein ACFSTE_07195 [Aquimarina hainanensis]|uniref:RING-type E3 ubiquitin transferase n=1 Tax=Aquimarina hainanensis TaxID=1578017 RepID=A0ABW5N4Q0_9FLAO
MEEISNILFQEINWIETFFLTLFCLFMGIFYAVIFSSFFNVNKPKWLFFVVLPGVLILTKILVAKAVFFVFISYFLGIFISFLLGVLYKTIRSYAKKKNKKKAVGSAMLQLVVVIAGLFLGAYLLQGYIVLLVVLFFIIRSLLVRTTKKNFLRLQLDLPTSKIRSMAMGLVEIEGSTSMLEPVISRIGKKECIGYRYTVEKISKDSEGRNQYSIIKEETVCNNFLLSDDTGSVEVHAKGIEFVWIKKDDSYSNGTKRYTQYLLKEDDQVLLIGGANSKNNPPFIGHEPIKDVFALGCINAVSRWNRYQPLLHSGITFLILFFIFTAFVLLADVIVSKNMMYIDYKSMWDNIPLINDL